MRPNQRIESTLRRARNFIPQSIFSVLAPLYHFLLSFIAAVVYRFPSRHIRVVGVTGTKGKSTVTELVAHILRQAGHKVALSNTLHFVIGENEERNMFKMSMPGRFFLQRFMRRALNEGCDWVVLEMTSQGVLTHRHRFIELDSLIFTNISPEHIEAHGSFKAYLKAKLSIAKRLNRSSKEGRFLVVNEDDEHARDFIKATPRAKTLPFSLSLTNNLEVSSEGLSFTFKDMRITSKLPGTFNAYNILAATVFADYTGIPPRTISKAIASFKGIRGRLESITPYDKELSKRQDFRVIVDYAHTPDSLEKLYKVFEGSNRICVLGNTGGGRDKWKRKEMARIAENYCEKIILTNEDPYDEDPKEIVREMANAITIPKYEIIMNRREAIRAAIRESGEGDVVLITGKGTDPYIMGPSGTALPWDDAEVTRDELSKYLRETYEE